MGALVSIIKSLFLMAIPTPIARVLYKQKNLVWIVHPRNTKDVVKKIGFLRNLSDKNIFRILQLIPPFFVSNFSGNHVNGYMLAIPVSPQILGSKEQVHINLSLKKTRQALKFAEKLGATSISLGGFLTSVVSRNRLEDEFDMEFYDGTRLLSRLVVEKVSLILSSKNIDSKVTTMGVIGATTKTGKLVSELLVQMTFEKIYLFGKTKENLDALKTKCLEVNPSAVVEVSTDLSQLSNCDINILTSYIQTDENISGYLKQKSIFIGAVEPVSPFVSLLEKERSDIELHKGVSVNTPDIIYDGYDLGLPTGNSFVCVTEAFLFTEGKDKAEVVYEEDLDNTLSKVKTLFGKYNFTAS